MRALLILSLLTTFTTHAANLVFKLKGAEVASFSSEQIKSGELLHKHGKLKSSDVKIFNVFRGYERTYEGYDLFTLLDVVYGQGWKTSRKISFLAADGYIQFAFTPKMLKAAQGKNGHLAFAEEGKNGFTLIEKQGKQIDPGPFYLVWTNFSEADKASHGDTLKWPYQLVTINID